MSGELLVQFYNSAIMLFQNKKYTHFQANTVQIIEGPLFYLNSTKEQSIMQTPLSCEPHMS